MRKNILIAACLFGALFYASCQNKPSAKLNSELDSVSYGLGVSMAQNLQMAGLDSVNSQAFAAGLEDFLSGEDTKIHPSMADQMISAYITSNRQKTSDKARKDSEDFLEKNKENAAVKTTESGLQYEELQEGDGASPDDNDSVTVHYTGKTIDGKVFDSSVDRGEPVTFQLNQVIQGWREGLQLMKEGAKYRLYLPSDLGYGNQGAGPDIPPHAALIFDVELISVTTVD